MKFNKNDIVIVTNPEHNGKLGVILIMTFSESDNMYGIKIFDRKYQKDCFTWLYDYHMKLANLTELEKQWYRIKYGF